MEPGKRKIPLTTGCTKPSNEHQTGPLWPGCGAMANMTAQ